MIRTLELRWFTSGTPPAEVKHWFNTNCPGKLLGDPEEWDDVYVYIPECDYLNIKLRQGSLEIKWRTAEVEVVQLGTCWEGKVEQWLKWSCEAQEFQSLIPGDLVQQKAWVGVKKVRSQRLYQGIAYELTQLNVNNSEWWSIAFEMASEDKNEIDYFKQTLSQVSTTYSEQPLLATHSYAYPHWLSLLT